MAATPSSPLQVRRSGLDPERLPAEGLSFDVQSGALSYNVDGTGATIVLTPDDVWVLARATIEFCAGQYLLGQIPTSGGRRGRNGH